MRRSAFQILPHAPASAPSLSNGRIRKFGHHPRFSWSSHWPIPTVSADCFTLSALASCDPSTALISPGFLNKAFLENLRLDAFPSAAANHDHCPSITIRQREVKGLLVLPLCAGSVVPILLHVPSSILPSGGFLRPHYRVSRSRKILLEASRREVRRTVHPR